MTFPLSLLALGDQLVDHPAQVGEGLVVVFVQFAVAFDIQVGHSGVVEDDPGVEQILESGLIAGHGQLDAPCGRVPPLRVTRQTHVSVMLVEHAAHGLSKRMSEP